MTILFSVFFFRFEDSCCDYTACK